jgi:ABC-2 type transport system permease protein
VSPQRRGLSATGLSRLDAGSVADPFTYAVHAFKSLLLKNTGFAAIGRLDLLVFSVVAMTAATMLFKRTL